MYLCEMRAFTGHADHCCYFKKLDTSYLILVLYVDDMLVADSSMEEISNLKEKLPKDFAKNLGAAKQILGMWISMDRVNRKLKLYHAVLSAVDKGVWAAV
jgi:predicted helicase